MPTSGKPIKPDRYRRTVPAVVAWERWRNRMLARAKMRLRRFFNKIRGGSR